MKDKLISQIKNYTPCNEQEEVWAAFCGTTSSFFAEIKERGEIPNESCLWRKRQT